MSDNSRHTPPIQHDEKDRVFYIEENGKQLAYIRYRLAVEENENELVEVAAPEQQLGLRPATPEVDFYTTYVSPESRGRGIAKKLVDHALDWAESKAYVIHASCWYAADLLALRN